ncbi:MAG: hypothetical protein ACRD3T_13320, partial [Terriglobia bacterium]
AVYDRRSRVFNQFDAHRAPLQQPLAINSHLLSFGRSGAVQAAMPAKPALSEAKGCRRYIGCRARS